MTVAVGIFVGQVRAESMGVVPAPDDGVAWVHDHSWCVEVVGVDVVHLNFTGGGGLRDYRDRNIAQPDGFLSHQPVIGLCRACIVAVFPDQLSVGIVEEQKPRTQRAVLDDALIQGVGFTPPGIVDPGWLKLGCLFSKIITTSTLSTASFFLYETH